MCITPSLMSHCANEQMKLLGPPLPVGHMHSIINCHDCQIDYLFITVTTEFRNATNMRSCSPLPTLIATQHRRMSCFDSFLTPLTHCKLLTAGNHVQPIPYTTHSLQALIACSTLSGAGRDLRALFGLLRRQGSPSNSTPPYAPLLLRTLCIMARHGGPSALFDFATDSAGILRTTPLQLPTSKGYSFATWLRIEEGGTGGAGVGVGEPPAHNSAGRALYALLHRSGDTRGIIASLSGQPPDCSRCTISPTCHVCVCTCDCIILLVIKPVAAH